MSTCAEHFLKLNPARLRRKCRRTLLPTTLPRVVPLNLLDEVLDLKQLVQGNIRSNVNVLFCSCATPSWSRLRTSPPATRASRSACRTSGTSCRTPSARRRCTRSPRGPRRTSALTGRSRCCARVSETDFEYWKLLFWSGLGSC